MGPLELGEGGAGLWAQCTVLHTNYEREVWEGCHFKCETMGLCTWRSEVPCPHFHTSTCTPSQCHTTHSSTPHLHTPYPPPHSYTLMLTSSQLPDKHGITAILAAIYEGHEECVKFLLDKVATQMNCEAWFGGL